MFPSITLIVTSILISSSSPFSIDTKNLLEMRLSHLENEFNSTKSLLSEVLSEVQKVKNISAYYLRKDDIKKISDSNELSEKLETLNKNINDTKDNFKNVINDLENKFDDLKEDVSSKIDSKVKRERSKKFITEESFNVVTKKLQDIPTNFSKKIHEISEDIFNSAITKDEFASFKLMMARDVCHLKFEEGEWVKFQQRGQYKNPQYYFAREMKEYVDGFGDPSKEFWLGLDKIVSLTNNGAELLVELETFEGEKVFARYSSFKVDGPEYRIHVSGYSGNAGDTMKIDDGMAFSTRDSDKDLWGQDCSSTRGHGGWWFNGCGLANLNGMNLGNSKSGYNGILWYLYAKDNRSFKSTKMMLRKKRI